MGQGPGEVVRVLNPSVFKPCPSSPRGEERGGKKGVGGRQEEGKKKEKNSDH